MQRTSRPAPTGTSGIGPAAHSSVANSQRGRNRQPTAQTAGDGTLPRIVGSVSATAARCGLAASSDRVYGCRGAR